MTDERMYTTTKAAATLGVSAQTIRRWVEAGDLRAEYVGLRRIMRISETELQRLAKEHQILFRPQ